MISCVRTLVPELGADVSACPSCHGHGVLVVVAAVRAFPDELAVFIINNLDFSVVAALHAVVALGIQLRIHDVFIDVLHDGNDSGDVVLHIRHFDVGNRAARESRWKSDSNFSLWKASICSATWTW